MRTRRPDHSRGAFAWLGAVAVLLASGVAGAQVVSSDQAAAVLVFPKIVVDTGGVLTGGVSVDTLVQIQNTNTTSDSASLQCFYVGANSCCGGPCGMQNPDPCDPRSSDPTLNCRSTGQRCVTSWTVNNFEIEATPGQPIGFVASVGATLPCNQQNNNCGGPQFGSVPNVPANPFIGELKCIEVDTVAPASVPQALTGVNDFTGTARIYASTTANGGSVDVREYNAIGIQSVSEAGTAGSTLCLGTSAPNCDVATHASCPGTLVLDHFFEGADPFDDGDTVGTTVTLIPCTEDLETSTTVPGTTVAQLLTINEFEQRFSSSVRVQCFETTRLSDVDSVAGTEPGDASSIFNVAIQGTLTGQTRIRGVAANAPGHGLLGIAEEFHSGSRGSFSTAFNLQNDNSSRGSGAGDTITIP